MLNLHLLRITADTNVVSKIIKLDESLLVLIALFIPYLLPQRYYRPVLDRV